MGNDISSIRQDDFALASIADYRMDARLGPGSGRMMRTYRFYSPSTDATAVAKTMVVDLTSPEAQTRLEEQRRELERIHAAVDGQPHVAAFAAWFVSKVHPRSNLHNITLLRPHFYTTLADRLASRPWLAPVEKVSIAKQLLDGLAALHAAGVVHGELTTENIALTAAGFVIVMDLASYKVPSVADDDPSEYLYYFQLQQKDTKTEKSRCYLAPERFDKATTDRLTPAMDVFSCGCVLMELFLNGERCLDLGDLIEYRRTFELPQQLQQKLAKIESSHVRAACRHMLHLKPADRLSADEYAKRLSAADQVPDSFAVLLPLLERLATTISPDARIAAAAEAYGQVLWETMGVRDAEGEMYFERVLGPVMVELSKAVDDPVDEATSPSPTSVPLFDTEALLKETEALLLQLEGFSLDKVGAASSKADPVAHESSEVISTGEATVERTDLCKNSLLIFLQSILANIRHVQRPASKLVALQLVERLARFATDEARLQRIVPVMISMLHDQDPLVRARVVQTLSHTLSIIEGFSPSDSKVFPQYIFKRVTHLISDPSLVARLAFAKSMAVLAETAHRFLDISHAVRLYEAVGSGTGTTTPKEESSHMRRDAKSAVFTDDVTKLLDFETRTKQGSLEHTESSAESVRSESALVAAGKTLISSTYNTELASLHETVSRWVIHIATDQSEHSALPKRALLSDLGRLCGFFGLDGVMSFILPQILAFLNDRKNWELRASLFEALPSLCHIIGRAATEEFVLPCVEIGLMDAEESVIRRALSCLTQLIEMNLLSRSLLLGSSPAGAVGSQSSSLLSRYVVLLIHPSDELRHEAAMTYSAAWKAVGSPAREVYFLPMLRPLLRHHGSGANCGSPKGLEACLRRAWSREQFVELLAKASFRTESSTEGAWTSVGVQVREKEASQVSSPEAAPKSDSEDSLWILVEGYLRILARQTSQSSAQDRPSAGALRTDLSNGIEGSVKLAQSIMFPRHDVAAKIESIPTWFSTLRDAAEFEKSPVTEATAIRSVSALGHVYGLSIMGPVEGASDIVGAGDDSQGLEDETRNVLRSPDAKLLEAAFVGQWGAETQVEPDVVDTSLLVTKLKALGVPPLPPKLGERLESTISADSTPKASAKDGTAEWKPKINDLVASSSTTTAHTAPVVRLAVSMDSTFFVTGSHDGTCRVWDVPQIEDSVGILDSNLVYTGHCANGPVRVNDIAMVEGSHSVVSGASDGSVHVWRVDMIASSAKPPQQDPARKTDGVKLVGTTAIRKLEPSEGEILSVSHFNSLSSSVITFATQHGLVHSWDLRCAKEPFVLKHGPELGHLTSVALGSDRNWAVAGTSRGYLCLWDVRFQEPVKLWRHSRKAPISRLATTVVAPPQSWGFRTGPPESSRPFIFAAAGNNECGMFDALTGSCRECFRVITSDNSELDNHVEEPPSLIEVALASNRESNLASTGINDDGLQRARPMSSINCMVGSMAHNQCYLMTGGSDAKIRFWDFSTISKCYIVSGASQKQARPSFERIDFDSQRRLMLCRQPRSLAARDHTRLSHKLYHGLQTPEVHHHLDAVQDLKILDNHALISCSRDCTVKVWR